MDFTNLYDIVLLIIDLLNISANLVILYIVCRFKFWKTPPYFCILNWSVLDILRLLTSPGIFSWYQEIHDVFLDSLVLGTCVCLFLAFQFGVILLLFILLLNEKIKCFERNYKKLICVIWCLVLVLIVLGALGGTGYLFFLHYISGLISIAVYLILLVTLFITCVAFIAAQSFSEDNFRLIFTLVSAYVFYWLLVLCLLVTYAFVCIYDLFTLHTYHPRMFLETVVMALAESCALMNVYILQKFDKRFKMYLARTFLCSNKEENGVVSFSYEQPKNETI